MNNDGWISVKDKLPKKTMKVRWRCIDGVEDIGFFNFDAQEFRTFDPRSEKEITHWKKFSSFLPLTSQNKR